MFRSTDTPAIESKFNEESLRFSKPEQGGVLVKHSPVLIATAVLTFVWAVVRATHQSITIDEADTYLAFVRPHNPGQWSPASNNHVLNTLLMRLSIFLFGLSEFTARIPALLGAGLYITSAYMTSRLVARSTLLQWTLFVCLACNPFIFDYMVAARGYGLATGFLLFQIYRLIQLHTQMDSISDRMILQTGAACSIAAALSFAANFSFALVNGVLISTILFWCLRAMKQTYGPFARNKTRYASAIAACLVPGATVAAFLTAFVVLRFPKSQLWYGSDSVILTIGIVIKSLLFEVNPNIVNPGIIHDVGRLGSFSLRAVFILTVVRFGFLFVNREVTIKQAPGLWASALSLAFAFGATLLAHYIAFIFFQVKLPLERTSLFFVPLAFLAFGIAAAMPPVTWHDRWIKNTLSTVLLLLGLYFLTCIRGGYFREWQYDADVAHVYRLLSGYKKTLGVQSIASNWRYTASLNFYRAMTGDGEFEEFEYRVTDPPNPGYPTDRKIYVLVHGDDDKFAESEKLNTVYNGELSDVFIAIRP